MMAPKKNWNWMMMGMQLVLRRLRLRPEKKTFTAPPSYFRRILRTPFLHDALPPQIFPLPHSRPFFGQKFPNEFRSDIELMLKCVRKKVRDVERLSFTSW